MFCLKYTPEFVISYKIRVDGFDGIHIDWYTRYQHCNNVLGGVYLIKNNQSTNDKSVWMKIVSKYIFYLERTTFKCFQSCNEILSSMFSFSCSMNASLSTRDNGLSMVVFRMVWLVDKKLMSLCNLILSGFQGRWDGWMGVVQVLYISYIERIAW